VSKSTTAPDLLVVGGGVIGLSVALEAARAGVSVTVLERDTPGSGATAVAAGMLAPTSEAVAGEQAVLELNRASADRWPAFAASIGVPLSDRGTLLLARDRDEAEALEREVTYREAHGLQVERLLPSAARRREPGLAPTVRAAVSVPGDTAVDPREVVAGVTREAQAAGVVVRAGAEVVSLSTDAGTRVSGVELSGGEHLVAGAVCVAAGAWSRTLIGLPDDALLPIRPVKGQLLELRDPSGAGLVGSVLRCEECYLVPRGDGRYVLGATVEERGFDTAVTAGAVFELLRAGTELVPGLAELQLVATRAGLRPGTPDNLPAIGRGSLPGLWWATGHFRHGVLLAPVTGALIAAGLTGADAPVDATLAEALDPRRFAGSRERPLAGAGR
jgi:glycine oxidase